MLGVLKDFKTFILRGNVVDLAVGIVIGAGFTAVVTAFVKDVLTPLIGIPGKLDFSSWFFEINGSKFLIGDFINSTVSFVIVAFVVFFLVVRPVNHMTNLVKPPAPPEPAKKPCPECLSSIPAAATRSAFCTAAQPVAEASATDPQT